MESVPSGDQPGNENLGDFPLHMLPPELKAFVEAVAEGYQVPADLPGVMALAVLAASIGGRIRVSATPDWIEPANIYAAVILPPGERKSAIVQLMTRPLRQVEAELVEDAKPRIAKARERRSLKEKRLEVLRKSAAAESGGDRNAEHEALKLSEELDLEKVPAVPRLIIDDCTAEKMLLSLAEQGGRLAAFSAEGSLFEVLAGRYSAGSPNIEGVLQAHAGDCIRVDRIGRESIIIENPALTIGVAIQPDVFRATLRPEIRGRGWHARFWWCAPQSKVGFRSVDAKPVPERLIAMWDGIIRAMSGLKECTIELDDDAKSAFRTLRAETEDSLRPGGIMHEIRDWGAKRDGLTLRVAAILAACEHVISRPFDEPISPISADIIRRAGGVTAFAARHAIGLLASPSDPNEKRLIDHLKMAGGESSQSELSRALRITADAADRLVASMRKSGRISTEVRPTSGRPATIIRLIAQ